jgi:membrane peptidoglycan carboxypeptidase
VGFTADYVAGVWMGYDDNRPLTGVTGSGLPAEIWREVMVRVHAGLPVRELPMEAPRAGWAEAPAPGEMHVPWAELQDQLAQPQPQPQVPQPAPQPQQDPVTNAINSVLDALFGGPVR